jgi:tRNA acetyltransferase TAN1
MCGDEYPIISRLDFQGLFIASTKIESKVVIQKIKGILKDDPNFFQYILKILPIDYVCETSVQTISEIIQSSYRMYINSEDRFKIVLNRRKSPYIDRQSIINKLASIINNKVDLEHPDKILRVEVLGNITGISYLNPNEIIKQNVL